MSTFVDYYKKFGLSRNLLSQKSFVSAVEKYCNGIIPISEEKLIECDKALSNPNLTPRQRAKLEAERAKYDYNSKFHGAILENIQYIIEDAGGEVTDDVIEEAYAFVNKEIFLDRVEQKRRKLISDRDTKGVDYSPEYVAEIDEQLRALDDDERLINEMYSVLSDKQRREEYKFQLDEYYSQEGERKAEEYKKETDKPIIPVQPDMTASERYVKRRLGVDFNPNMSRYSKGVDKAGKGISWSVTLTEKPKLYYSGKVSDKNSPEYGTDIIAFTYGTFNYSTLYNESNMPFYTDSISEIIGVTKTYPDQTRRTYMVVAPTGSLGEIKYATTDEIDRLQEEGRSIIPLMDALTYRKLDERLRLSRELRTQAEGVRMLKSNRDRKVISFNRLYNQNRLKHFYDDLDEYEAGLKRPIFIRKNGSSRCPKELEEIAGSVYFSDYLLENAALNNGNYLGTLTPGKVSFDAPLEEERIRACFYANINGGKAEQLTNEGITEVVQVSSLGELLKAMAPVQEKYAKKHERNKRNIEGR